MEVRATTTGERLKKRREMLDISVDDVAEAIGKSRATVYRYESGYIDDIPVSIIAKLAEMLRTTPAYLMGWTDSPDLKPKSFVSREEQSVQRVQMFAENYEAFLYLLNLSEYVDEDANLYLENLAGDLMEITPAKRVDLLLALTKEALRFVRRCGEDGINDLYDQLDAHGKAVVDAVIQLEKARLDQKE